MGPGSGAGAVPAGEIATLSYERALEELDGLIARLEAGRVDLDEAISCYERGTRLAQHCERLLDRTEQKVTQVVVAAGGEREQPFDPLPAPTAPSPSPTAGVPTSAAPGPASPLPTSPAPASQAPASGPAAADRPAEREEVCRPRARSVGASLPFANPGHEARTQGPAIDPDDIPF